MHVCFFLYIYACLNKIYAYIYTHIYIIYIKKTIHITTGSLIVLVRICSTVMQIWLRTLSWIWITTRVSVILHYPSVEFMDFWFSTLCVMCECCWTDCVACFLILTVYVSIWASRKRQATLRNLALDFCLYSSAGGPIGGNKNAGTTFVFVICNCFVLSARIQSISNVPSAYAYIHMYKCTYMCIHTFT